MLVRSSISMWISLNSCSVKLTGPPWRSLIVLDSIHCLLQAHDDCCLTMGAHRYRLPVGFLGLLFRLLGSRTELRKRFVELIGKLDQLADRGHGAARSLRSLPGDVGNDLHGVRDAFCSAHLLFRSQGNFLHEVGGLADHGSNCV